MTGSGKVVFPADWIDVTAQQIAETVGIVGATSARSTRDHR
jgi:hypothetical protein